MKRYMFIGAFFEHFVGKTTIFSEKGTSLTERGVY